MKQASTSTQVKKQLQKEEKYRHYVSRTAVRRAIVNDGSVVALCGKRWKPTFTKHDLPICSTCKDLYSFLDND